MCWHLKHVTSYVYGRDDTGANLDNIKGNLELTQGKQNRKSQEDPANLAQSVSMGFLCVQRTFSMYIIACSCQGILCPQEKFENQIMRLNLEASLIEMIQQYAKLHSLCIYDLATYTNQLLFSGSYSHHYNFEKTLNYI